MTCDRRVGRNDTVGTFLHVGPPNVSWEAAWRRHFCGASTVTYISIQKTRASFHLDLTKYIIVRATCGSDRSSEVRVVESEFICRTLYAFTVARHTELSKRDIYPFVCSGARVSPDFRHF